MSSILVFFQHLGIFGPFAIEILDVVLFMPFSIDLLLIAMISASNSYWITAAYVASATVGTLAGAYPTDLVMRKIGKTGLKKFLKPKQIKKIETKLKAHTIWALFSAAALPPPFPFTPIVWTASVLQGPRWKLFTGILLGQLLRFTVEAVLASIFGKQLMKVADFKAFTYSIYIVIAVSVGGSFYYVYRWIAYRGA